MNDKEFLELCIEENKKIALIEVKEVVSDEMAFKALIIVNNMYVGGNGDALLFAAALNVLNTYVKQADENKKTIGYSFKNNVNVLLNHIVNNQSEYLDAEIQEDNGMSLGLVSIYTIQFSFHNVSVKKSTQCLKVKDPEHPRLSWDGIRKQLCSCSLFDFAYENTYDRTNKMLDGTDFVTAINSLTDEFRAGIKTISDATRTIYRKETGNNNDKSIKQKVTYYPYKDKYFIPLLDMDGQTLIEKINDRTLVPDLNEDCMKKTGQCISFANLVSAKYAFQTLMMFLYRAGLNPTTGVNISYNKIPTREGFVVFFASSSQDDKCNLLCVELSGWTKMKNAEDGFISVYDKSTDTYRTTRHPCYRKADELIFEFESYLGESYNMISHCMLFYDAVKNEQTDIVSGLDEREFTSQVFYYSDRDKFVDYIKPTVEAGNGVNYIEIFKTYKNSLVDSSSNTISYEHIISVSNCIDSLKNDSKSLIVFNCRKAGKNTDFLEYVISQLNANNIFFDLCTLPTVKETVSADTALFKDCIPCEQAIEKYSKVVIVCDLYSPLQASKPELDDLIENAHDKGFKFIQNTIVNALGFSDGGAGNNFLIRYFSLAEITYRYWKAESYPISVVSSEDDFNSNDGITNITIPDTVGINNDERTLEASLEDTEMIYQSFLNAPNGVRLLIKDQNLLQYIEDALKTHDESVKSLTELIESLDENEAEMHKYIRSQSDNSTDYNKYLTLAVKHIHMDAWEKLAEESQDWIVTGLSSFYYMKDTDITMDFSGVEVLISKTFESELVQRIAVKYVDYLKKKYGDKYIEQLPSSLVQDTQDGLKPLAPEKVTMGSIPFVMGLNTNGKIKSEKEYDNFKAYCNDVLLINPENADSDLVTICDVVYYIRVNFRNNSAHTTAVSYESAQDCISYSITDKRMLGVVLDMFRF